MTTPVLEARTSPCASAASPPSAPSTSPSTPARSWASSAPTALKKTTFFNCLTGLYVPTEGTVSYKGTVLPPKPHLVTKAGIARTFQNIRLFANMTVLENVLVGRHTRTKEGLWSALLRGPGFKKAEKASEERAMELLEFIGLAHKRDHLARNLPYGEQRKLEIARALASEPGLLLLLDEPTA